MELMQSDFQSLISIMFTVFFTLIGLMITVSGILSVFSFKDTEYLRPVQSANGILVLIIGLVVLYFCDFFHYISIILVTVK